VIRRLIAARNLSVSVTGLTLVFNRSEHLFE
jgi:hypothetical protein